MNTIRLEVDKKYNFYLENIYISSKVYDEDNRDVFTNSYSLSFNIPLFDKDATKLFNYLQTNKSSFQNVKFEDCKLYINEDLLSETVTFTLIEVAGNSFNCFILLNEYNKILLLGNRNINEIKINETELISTLDLYSGSTTMYNPIPATLNGKFIMNNNYNYNGTDNYLTINKDLQITEEDIVFNFNVAGLLRSYLNTGLTTSDKCFSSLDKDYFFKIGKTELNYNTTYNKVVNTGLTFSSYNNFKYNNSAPFNNFFRHPSYASPGSDVFTYLPYILTSSDENDDGYKYSYFKSEINDIINYNLSTGTTEPKVCNILNSETIKWINLPIYNSFNTGNTLSNKFNNVIPNNSSTINNSIFYSENNKDIFNSFIIPSYNDYELEFNADLLININNIRLLLPSSDYNHTNDFPFRQNLFNNMSSFAVGFSNSEYSDSVDKVLSFVYNYYYEMNFSSSTVQYIDIILDEYFDEDILNEVNGLMFYKVCNHLDKDDSNRDILNGLTVIQFYTNKMLSNNNGNISLSRILPTNANNVYDRNISNEMITLTLYYSNKDNNISFKYIHPKESEIKLLKPVFIRYDDSGFIVPSDNKNGFQIHGTTNIGRTAYFNRELNLTIDSSNFKIKCKYNQPDNKYKIDSTLLPDISLSELLKQFCILKNRYVYFDDNIIDLKSYSELYILKNYSSFIINKIFQYKNNILTDYTELWGTSKDESNQFSIDLNKDTGSEFIDKIKYNIYFSNTQYQKRIYNSGNTLSGFTSLQLSSPERYNKNRISYDGEWNRNIDGGKDFYDGYYLYWLPNTPLDDYINNNDNKSVKFINKLGTITEETIFSPKDLFLETAIYNTGRYRIYFGAEYKTKFEATIKIPYHIWKECKNRPILLEEDGVKYIIFEIEQYNISTEQCTIKGIKS